MAAPGFDVEVAIKLYGNLGHYLPPGGNRFSLITSLDDGATVTTPRTDVRYIVTEFGVASMFGKNLRQRARALIGIAHPNFRDVLSAEFEARFKEKF